MTREEELMKEIEEEKRIKELKRNHRPRFELLKEIYKLNKEIENIKVNNQSLKEVELKGIQSERQRCLKDELEFLESLTYGCDKVLESRQARCGDISFSNEIILCEKCKPMYDKIQKRIEELKKQINKK